MSVKRNVLWITRTAVFIALLVTVQIVTAPLGNQFVTGSAVNLILVLAFLICGPATGMIVGFVSPIFVSMIGFGPAFPPIVPFIVLGNVVFIIAWFLLRKLNSKEAHDVKRNIANYFIVVVAALIKFLTLYLTIVKFAMPVLLDLNAAQSAVLGLAFSYPQIITATIGGVIALTIAPRLQAALKINN